MAKRAATKPAVQRDKDAAKTEVRHDEDGVILDDEEDADADAVLAAAKFDPESLIGEVGDFLLQELRNTSQRKPWEKMTQREQELLIDRAARQARAAVAGVVASIASRGLRHMDGQMEDAGSFKDGFFMLKVAVPMTADNALLLARRSGAVQVVFATADDALEEAEETETVAERDAAPAM